MPRFTKSFIQQEPIPEEAIARACEIMRTGALHRYSSLDGEPTETALLEAEFASYLGQKYALACASGGCALHIALKAAGLQAGQNVLCNAYTLAPVPGAIENAGGVPLLVECAEDFTIDLEDLEAKALSTDVRFLVLSHMRGHIANMTQVMSICNANEVLLIEDAAHTMGAKWRGKASGAFGAIGCFSTQTYKHINSGEGGFISTDDAAIMAKAVMYSGSYMFYEKHIAAPSAEAYQDTRLDTPNYSARMDNLRASILRPQLAKLDENCHRWNELYRVLEESLNAVDGIVVASRSPDECFVGSSIQFRLPDFDRSQIIDYIDINAQDGVSIKWFGNDIPQGYTSRYDSWRYLADKTLLPHTDSILASACDIRIPLSFNSEDCRTIGAILAENYLSVAY